jgi:hypothetical protein
VHALALAFVLLPVSPTEIEIPSPEEALAAAEQRLEEGGLTREESVRAWLDKADAFASLRDPAKAERAFAVALRIDRGLAPPALEDELERTAFERARDSLPPDDQALDVRVVVVERGGPPGMTVQVEADDMGLVGGAELRVAGEVVSELQISRSDPKARSPLHPGNVAGLLTVIFVDAYGNELRRVELEGRAQQTTMDKVIERDGTSPDVTDADVTDPDGLGGFAPSGELRWLTLGGATAIAVGAIGVAAAGMWLASVDAGDVDAPEGAREVALVGVGIATGVIVLGGVFVVTDFVLSPPGG